MRRREFIGLMGASVTSPFAALAQEPGRTYRLGCLLAAPRSEPPTTVSPHTLPATPEVSSEHPPLGISDLQAGVHLLDGPRWQEAADRHDAGRQCAQSRSAAALGAAEVPFGTERGWDVRSQSDLQR